METLITNIQKFSVHDGDGIRTTVFFKGCSLNCAWCHNPESLSFKPQLMFYAERCGGCGNCLSACKEGCVTMKDGLSETDLNKCTGCSLCADACGYNAREIAGRAYAVDKLADICLQDLMFYESSGGGVTLSGGEVMQQDTAYVQALLKKLKKKGVHITVDTCGFAPFAAFENILEYVDVFLYDIKIFDSGKHKKFTGVANELILENLIKLSRAGAVVNVRMPMINEVNCSIEEAGLISGFLKENVSVKKISLLPYHNTGRAKSARLGAGEGAVFTTPSGELLSDIKEVYEKAGFSANIGF